MRHTRCRLPLLEPTHEALDRLVGTQKSILLNQILVDALGAQPGLHLRINRCLKGLAPALAAQMFAIETPGSLPTTLSEPGVEMTGAL